MLRLNVPSSDVLDSQTPLGSNTPLAFALIAWRDSGAAQRQGRQRTENDTQVSLRGAEGSAAISKRLRRGRRTARKRVSKNDNTKLGQVAQLVEQRTENPRVGGSIPPLATKHAKAPMGPFVFKQGATATENISAPGLSASNSPRVLRLSLFFVIDRGAIPPLAAGQ